MIILSDAFADIPVPAAGAMRLHLFRPAKPECQTWNLQLSNYWMQSLDYRFFTVCVNKHTAHYEPDGSVKIVIAAHDPGPKYPNWLNTLHHGQGGMLGRYVGAKVFPKEMKSKVMKLSELE